jgi:drug/metabolite transporter (DMT)-like permease
MQNHGRLVEASKNPFILMPILLLMWGSFAAISKLLLHNLDSYQVMFNMYGIAIAAFSIAILFKGKFSEMLSWKLQEVTLLIACGIFSFLYDFLYLKSLELIPAVEASMLNYLFPIFIVLLAVPIHKEKLNFFKIFSIMMGFAGTLLLTTKGNVSNIAFTNLEGDIFAILAAISWGLFTNLIKKNQKDMLLSTFFVTAIAFVLSIGATFASSHFILPQKLDLLGVFWISISNIVFGFFLYFQSLKYSSASLIASFTFFTPFVTLIFIVMLLGERLTLVDCIAALLIICSVSSQKLGKFRGRRKRHSIVNIR